MSLMSRFSLLATQQEAPGRRFAQGDDHEEHDESSERDHTARDDGVLDEVERNSRAEDDWTENDRTTGLEPENGAFNSANLKLVFDLEYRAPD